MRERERESERERERAERERERGEERRGEERRERKKRATRRRQAIIKAYHTSSKSTVDLNAWANKEAMEIVEVSHAGHLGRCRPRIQWVQKGISMVSMRLPSVFFGFEVEDLRFAGL